MFIAACWAHVLVFSPGRLNCDVTFFALHQRKKSVTVKVINSQDSCMLLYVYLQNNSTPYFCVEYYMLLKYGSLNLEYIGTKTIPVLILLWYWSHLQSWFFKQGETFSHYVILQTNVLVMHDGLLIQFCIMTRIMWKSLWFWTKVIDTWT